MQASNRIIINTLAQYARTIINMLLSLASVRLVLEYLGVNDYGLYVLVAGVVSLLSFLTNSLVGSTQRFLSVTQGKKNIQLLKEVFCNSLLLHIFLGLLIALVLLSLTPILFNGFLNIPKDRTSAAIVLYMQVVCMVYISFVAAPYRALLVSRENIVYTSLIDVLDGVLKVLLVLLIPLINFDRLIMYGWMMFSISLFNLLSFAIYSQKKYEECIYPKVRYLKIKYLKELCFFTGWIIYSAGCVALRNQGLAILLNKILGTIVNAAYGIGVQISNMISLITSSLNNAIAPQLMASEGKGDRNHMWLLAEIESKFSFLLLAMIGIPTFFEMENLLGIWLKEVPENAALFGRMFLLMQMFDMLTTGLSLANKAIGKLGLFTIVTYTPKLFIMPIAWAIIKFNGSLVQVSIIMVLIEIICMLLRIPLFRKEEGFSALNYLRNVIARTLVPFFLTSLICFAIYFYIDFQLRFLVTYIVSISIFPIISYEFSLSQVERQKLVSILVTIKNKMLIKF